MKRIDPASVVGVFERLNLKPVTSTFVGDVEKRECCVLTALYCDRFGCTDAAACLEEVGAFDDPEIDLSEAIGFDASGNTDYVNGIIRGWDRPDTTIYGSRRHREGIKDAIAARKAVDEWNGGPIPRYEEEESE